MQEISVIMSYAVEMKHMIVYVVGINLNFILSIIELEKVKYAI
jgi:hypothetical protein